MTGAPEQGAPPRALQGIAPPFAAYSNGVAGGGLVCVSGQLGVDAEGHVPEDARAQADLCFAAVRAILDEAGAGPVLQLRGYVTDRAYMPAYMAARDAFAAGMDPLPASTLVIVSGFTRPEVVVEAEALAVL